MDTVTCLVGQMTGTRAAEILKFGQIYVFLAVSAPQDKPSSLLSLSVLTSLLFPLLPFLPVQK